MSRILEIEVIIVDVIGASRSAGTFLMEVSDNEIDKTNHPRMTYSFPQMNEPLLDGHIIIRPRLRNKNKDLLEYGN